MKCIHLLWKCAEVISTGDVSCINDIDFLLFFFMEDIVITCMSLNSLVTHI